MVVRCTTGDRLGRPRGLLRAVGIIEVVAAVFLLIPHMRISGIAAVAGVTMAGKRLYSDSANGPIKGDTRPSERHAVKCGSCFSCLSGAAAL